MTASVLPPHLDEQARAVLGDVWGAAPLAGSHGDVRAWRIETARGTVVARRARSARTAQQEAAALRALHRAPGAAGRVPELIAATPDAVLVTWVSGTPWSGSASLAALAERASWLHGVAYEDRDPVELDAAVEMRAMALAASLDGIWPEAAAWLRRLADVGAAAFRGRQRSWCHGDLRRDNLVVDDDGVIGLIDFEHARGDDPAFDVARLELDLERPDAGGALDGLWRGLDDAGRHLTRAMVASATLVWGRAHGDAAFEAAGRRQITAMRPR